MSTGTDIDKSQCPYHVRNLLERKVLESRDSRDAIHSTSDTLIRTECMNDNDRIRTTQESAEPW